MTRAATYARVSSAMQRDAKAIESQRRGLPAFVERQGWTLVGTYADDGRSGKAGTSRPGLDALIAALAAGGIDVVVVNDMARLTRSEAHDERGAILGAVQRAGAKLAFASTGQILDLSSGQGDLLASLFAVFSAQENRERREKALRGRELNVSRGRKPAGVPPLGYVATPDGKLAPGPLAPAVAELFARVAGGESARAVAADLEQRGLRLGTAARWPGRAAAIVRATVYRGEWTTDRARGQRIAVPPIVDEPTWWAAQDALDRLALRGLDRTRHVYLAAGRVVCGLCGARVGIHSGNGHTYYQCSARRHATAGSERCALPMLPVSRIDAMVWDRVVRELERPDLAERLAEARAGAEDAAPWDGDAADARRRLAELQRAEEALLERFTRGSIGAPAMDAQLARISDRRRWLEGQAARAAAAGAETRRRAAAVADAAALLAPLRARLVRATPEERRDLVGALLPGAPHVVTLHADGHVSLVLAIGGPAGVRVSVAAS